MPIVDIDIAVPLAVFSSPCLRYTVVCPITTIPISNTTSIKANAFYIVLFDLNEIRPTFQSCYINIGERDEINARSYQKVALVSVLLQVFH